MNHRFACMVAAGLSLIPGARATISAAPLRHSIGDVEILIGGAVQPRYAHDGRWYVEAQKGREYAVRLHNPHGVRVAVALSVDGLNTIDARETTAADARKWVLGPYETVTISGWQTSRSEARHFEFTTEARSYGQALGKTTNLGIISAVFFKERVARADIRSVEGLCDQTAGCASILSINRVGQQRCGGDRKEIRMNMRQREWAAGRTTRSSRSGWISKTRRRRC